MTGLCEQPRLILPSISPGRIAASLSQALCAVRSNSLNNEDLTKRIINCSFSDDLDCRPLRTIRINCVTWRDLSLGWARPTISNVVDCSGMLVFGTTGKGTQRPKRARRDSVASRKHARFSGMVGAAHPAGLRRMTYHREKRTGLALEGASRGYLVVRVCV